MFDPLDSRTVDTVDSAGLDAAYKRYYQDITLMSFHLNSTVDRVINICCNDPDHERFQALSFDSPKWSSLRITKSGYVRINQIVGDLIGVCYV